MQKFFTIVFLLLCSGKVAAQQNVSDSTLATDSIISIKLPTALDRVLRHYEQGWTAKDAESLAALFTHDGFILRPGHTPVRGREAIAIAYQNAGGPLFLRAYAYEMSDSIAYIIGGYRPDLNMPDGGKFTLTLRLESDGKWYIFSDMDNYNQ